MSLCLFLWKLVSRDYPSIVYTVYPAYILTLGPTERPVLATDFYSVILFGQQKQMDFEIVTYPTQA